MLRSTECRSHLKRNPRGADSATLRRPVRNELATLRGAGTRRRRDAPVRSLTEVSRHERPG
jgi:hypothetical protein